MSRPRKQAYRSQALSELTRQLLYSPPDKRAEVVRHAEQLHDELDPSKNYPIDFVVYRLTDRRVPPSESVMLVGEAIKPDLRLLIDALSRSIEMPCDEGDPGSTTQELARSLGVSTKTITRWREAGLRWRWGVRGASAKPMVLFPRSALEAFQQTHPERVPAASMFTRLSDKEKSRLISRARRLAEATDAAPKVILSHLSKRSGRSIESIRQLIHRYDTDHPGHAVFTDRTAPLTGQQKRVINRAYNRGITVTALSARFSKSRSTIYRAIHEGWAQHISALSIRAVYSPTFEREDADEVLTQPIKRQGPLRRLGPEVIDGLPDKLKPIYDRPTEPDDVVRSLIVRYNYLKYRATQLQSIIAESPPRASDLREFSRLFKRIDHARGEVIAAVLPVVLSVVLRQQAGGRKEPASRLIPMLSRAHRVLIEEIDRFDPAVAHPFESVLTNRLLRVLAKPDPADDPLDEAGMIEQLTAAGLATA